MCNLLNFKLLLRNLFLKKSNFRNNRWIHFSNALPDEHKKSKEARQYASKNKNYEILIITSL